MLLFMVNKDEYNNQRLAIFGEEMKAKRACAGSTGERLTLSRENDLDLHNDRARAASFD